MRVHRSILGVGIVVTVLLTSPAVRSDELDAFRATFMAGIEAFNARDLNAFMAPVHEDIVLFGLLSPFSIRGREAFRQVVQNYFADHERATFTLVNPGFRIAGTTALAWGHYQLIAKPKDGPLAYIHGRYTYTYTKSDGTWALVAIHLSRFQSTVP